MIFIYTTAAFVLGAVITWLWMRSFMQGSIQKTIQESGDKFSELDREFAAYKSGMETRLGVAAETSEEEKKQIHSLNTEIISMRQRETDMNIANAKAAANEASARESLKEKITEIDQLKQALQTSRNENEKNIQLLATAEAANNSLSERLQSQLEEMEKLNARFASEFELVANKILEEKTKKFTDVNEEKLKGILDPLGQNIREFKQKVEEAYSKENAQRFSLGERVKELAELNRTITEETRNLTKALKGESKTQGRWGEIILEKILEKSGLRNGEEYFMEYQLFDADGKALRSEAEGKKMRPDALVMYPDNRHVIIDAKVSLNAFVRFIECEEESERAGELKAHVEAMKSHIASLSTRAYDDYDKTLDFVMMFVPNEPAYIAAMQGDPEIWNYAYDKRILLISPTNLIAALKLMVDLWKREYQNRNAQAIAERGAKMYDKFVGFVENLKSVGNHLEKAQEKYNDTFKQLASGNDNLVSQATKLKNLGIKNKKELAKELAAIALQSDQDLNDLAAAIETN